MSFNEDHVHVTRVLHESLRAYAGTCCSTLVVACRVPVLDLQDALASSFSMAAVIEEYYCLN